MHPTRPFAPIALALLLLAGCGSEDDAQRRLTMASAKLQGVPSGRGTIPDPVAAGSIFQEVRQELQPVLDRGRPAEQAAASLIIAETQLSEASASVRAASEQNQKLRDRLSEIASVLGVWTVSDTKREVAASFDAGEQRETLRADLARLDQQRDAAARERGSLQQELDAINGQIDALRAQADGHRQQAASLDMQADSAPPAQRVSLVRQAQEHARAADALIVQGELLRGEIEKLVPRIERLSLEIESASKDRALRDASLATLEESIALRAEAVRNAQAEADAFKAELLSLLFDGDGLESFRTGASESAHAEAIAALEKSHASARKASSALRQGSQLMSARILQARGQVLLNRARTLSSYANTLDRIAQIPAFAGEPRLARAIAEVNESARAAFADAAASLQEASDAFSSAGMSGDAQDELESLQASLARSIQAARDLAGAMPEDSGDSGDSDLNDELGGEG